MKKKQIFHRKYIINCPEDEFLEFVKKTIAIICFHPKKPCEKIDYKFNGKIDLKKRLISFYHESAERNSIDPNGLIRYSSINDLVYIDFTIELSLWNFFMPIILTFASTILIYRGHHLISYLCSLEKQKNYGNIQRSKSHRVC